MIGLDVSLVSQYSLEVDTFISIKFRQRVHREVIYFGSWIVEADLYKRRNGKKHKRP